MTENKVRVPNKFSFKHKRGLEFFSTFDFVTPAPKQCVQKLNSLKQPPFSDEIENILKTETTPPGKHLKRIKGISCICAETDNQFFSARRINPCSMYRFLVSFHLPAQGGQKPSEIRQLLRLLNPWKHVVKTCCEN